MFRITTSTTIVSEFMFSQPISRSKIFHSEAKKKDILRKRRLFTFVSFSVNAVIEFLQE